MAYFDALPFEDRTYSNLKACFIQESNTHKLRSSDQLTNKFKEESAAFMTKRRSNYRGNFNNRNNFGNNDYSNFKNRKNNLNLIKCYKCGKSGHKADKCWSQLGNNDAYSDNSRNFQGNRFSNNSFYNSRYSSSNNKRIQECFLCNKEGHIAKYCRNKNNDNEKRRACFTVGLLSTNQNINENKLAFYIDSGASDHMISDDFSNIMKNIENFNSPLLVSCSKKSIHLTSNSYGDIDLDFLGCGLVFENVLVVNDLHSNLLSLTKLIDNNLTVNFLNNKVLVIDNVTHNILFTGYRRGNLYCIAFDIPNSGTLVQANNSFINYEDKNVQLWHKRFAHINYYSLDSMISRDLAIGLDINKIDKSKLDTFEKCEICVLSKQSVLPFNQHNEFRSSQPLELIHTDLMIINILGRNQEKYVLTFIDDFSGFKVVYCMKNKTETLTYFQDFLIFVHANTKFKIKRIRCDKGKEYDNEKFRDFCKENNIFIQFVTQYTPQLNSCAERNNRTIAERARAILLESKVLARCN